MQPVHLPPPGGEPVGQRRATGPQRVVAVQQRTRRRQHGNDEHAGRTGEHVGQPVFGVGQHPVVQHRPPQPAQRLQLPGHPPFPADLPAQLGFQDTRSVARRQQRHRDRGVQPGQDQPTDAAAVEQEQGEHPYRTADPQPPVPPRGRPAGAAQRASSLPGLNQRAGRSLVHTVAGGHVGDSRSESANQQTHGVLQSCPAPQHGTAGAPLV